MTLDREQVRRDDLPSLRAMIEQFIPAGFRDEYGIWHEGPLRDHALAELEQAERRLVECAFVAAADRERAEQAERERDDYLWQRDAAKDELRAAEAHLAAVPALVGKLHERAIENGECPVCEHTGLSFYKDGEWTESWAHFADCPVRVYEQAQEQR